MWLSSNFYERAPQYWLLIGLLLVITGTYLGLQVERMYMYFGVATGVTCIVWSVVVFIRRAKRLNRQPIETYDEYLEQTCELNQSPDGLKRRF
ncbi:MAG: hypothetical protein OEU90_05255 [Gammaproteobacteria bacterium]|jgi:hypothetical protein|nr:hypothetical protein [Gammaproteobacteria bacterium]MDH3751156.1 hypothetical protein [Gammaproteobacteria bacterium]MDH3804868.1 hypothetical protein [Gammaproteobacteria bacterium]